MLLLIIFACVVGYVLLAFAVLVAVTGELLDLVWPGSHSDQWDADLAMIEPPRTRTHRALKWAVASVREPKHSRRPKVERGYEMYSRAVRGESRPGRLPVLGDA